jgi:hypothetical protein
LNLEVEVKIRIFQVLIGRSTNYSARPHAAAAGKGKRAQWGVGSLWWRLQLVVSWFWFRPPLRASLVRATPVLRAAHAMVPGWCMLPPAGWVAADALPLRPPQLRLLLPCCCYSGCSSGANQAR